MRGGHECALEGGGVGRPGIEQFIDVILIEDFVFFGEVVKTHVWRLGVLTHSLLVQLRLPVLEVMCSGRQIVIFFSGGFGAIGRVLRCFHKS